MKRYESLSPDELKSILESEYRIHFFSKRTFSIPIVTAEKLKEKVGPRRENTTLYWVQVLHEFLLMPAIGDGFGANHSQRIACYKDIKNRFGKSARDFLNQYASNNQFRLNKLSNVLYAFNSISDRLLNPELQNYFQTSTFEVYGMLTGAGGKKEYVDIDSIQEKLQIIHTFEDKTVEALGKLSR